MVKVDGGVARALGKRVPNRRAAAALLGAALHLVGGGGDAPVKGGLGVGGVVQSAGGGWSEWGWVGWAVGQVGG